MMRWVTFQAMLYKERVNHVKITLLLFPSNVIQGESQSCQHYIIAI
jgi:hypothetical protein